MTDLAVTLRAAQLAAHAHHNLVKGPTFFPDHEFLGELYGTYETAYDHVIERMIGLGKTPDLRAVTKDAAGLFDKIMSLKGEWSDVFLRVEEAIRHDAVVALAQKPTDGTQNFLQGLCDESESRTYKLRQRAA
jgi:DNA-binding ferritin-like protein